MQQHNEGFGSSKFGKLCGENEGAVIKIARRKESSGRLRRVQRLY